MTSTTLTDSLQKPVVAESIASKLKRAERLNKIKSLGLILPLIIFLIVVFLIPLVLMLQKSVDSPEIPTLLPTTVVAMNDWDGKNLPPETVYKALAADVATDNDNDSLGNLGKRLNNEIAGYRSLLNNTADALPFDPEPASYKDALVETDARWGDANYWQAIYQNRSSFTWNYILSALDLKKDARGHIVKVSENEAIYQSVFVRTLTISLVITLICLVLAYPVAYLLATLPEKTANLLMICVLLPFWTSVLVRIAAWIVLLQANGLVNRLLEMLGLIDSPLQLIFNRVGVYIAMVHIMLPFMILPLYSVMKGIPPSYQRAAISLGCPPIISFWLVYFPQTWAGIGAGSLLVFIMSIGYYITPALVGSPNDQMVSYFVAFYTNNTINWGMATALGGLLLIATLLLYVIYNWLVGASRLRLG